ncbi:MAG: FAD-binding protein [Eubacterium sp.]|nr:FAD-binding protein [Eubacterium sp.]
MFDKDGKKLREMVPVARGFKWNEENMRHLASLKGGHLIIADTVEKLSKKAGIPCEKLAETIERYNAMCENGNDEDFGKDADYLLPIKNGPFYAVRTFLMSDGAEGGIPIDAGCRVVGKQGVVDGLYAAGDNTGGNIFRVGKRRMGITNEYSWAICSGMIAADSIIEQVGKFLWEMLFIQQEVHSQTV